MRKIQIFHRTEYRYTSPVQLLPHHVMIRPRGGHDLRIESSRLRVEPAATTKWFRDLHGNSVGRLLFNPDPVERLRIESKVDVTNYETAPYDFIIDKEAVRFPFSFDPEVRTALSPFQLPCFPNDSASIREWVGNFWEPGQTIETWVLLTQMNEALARDFSYRMREEPGVQSPGQTLGERAGSCRDLATLLIEACRFLGLGARFVSGYLLNSGSEQHGATHAWSELFLPGAGWKGFDSTSGRMTGPDHIATAVARHPEEVPPVAGSFVGGINTGVTMDVVVQVQLPGRPTQPTPKAGAVESPA